MYCSNKKTDIVDLDKQYSPSLNTKRFQNHPKPEQEVINNFCETLKNETKRVRAKYNVLLNVHYAADTIDDKEDNRFVDIYFKEQENGTPICVYIHGGYWQQLDRSTSGSFVAPFVEKGYRVIAMDYNLCPRVTLEQLIEQTLQFYQWLMTYAQNTNATHIELIGHSAGSHLLALLLNSRMPATAFTVSLTNLYFISGVYDLRELWQLPSVNPNNILFLDAQKAITASPMLWHLEPSIVEYYKGNNTKMHLIVGAHEGDTFINQSKCYGKKLSEAGMHTKVAILDNYDHFNLIEDMSIVNSVIHNYIMSESNKIQ